MQTRTAHTTYVVCSIFFVSAIVRNSWASIVLPFSNPLGIVGPLTVQHFNPANNFLRYLMFVLAPTLGFLVTRGWKVGPIPPERNQELRLRAGVIAVLVGPAIVYVVARVADFFVDPLATTPLDFLHEGETLSAGFTYATSHRAWSGTFFVHGLFYDPLRSVLAWRVFGHQTIGAVRLFSLLLKHVVPLLLICFLLTLAISTRRAVGDWQAWGTVACLLAVFLGTEGRVQYLDLRDCYALLVASATAIVLCKPSWWLSTGSGILAGFGLFNTIERGAYMIVAAIATLVFVAVAAKSRQYAIILGCYVAGVCVSLAASRIVLGSEEFTAFVENLFYWVRNKDLMDAYVYPRPFTREPLLYTVPLLLNGLSLLAWAIAVPVFVRRRELTRLGINTFLVAIACLFFRSALGRSDAGHILYVSTFTYLAVTWTLLNWVPRFVLVLASVTSSAFLVICAFGQISASAHRPDAMLAFRARAASYVALDDAVYLGESDRAAVAAMRERLASQRCSFVYPTSPAMHYLLKKPSCTRFYFTWFATAIPHQRESIQTLERLQPTEIVWMPSDGGSMDGFKAQDAFSELDAYVQSHYEPDPIPLGNWNLARRRPIEP